MCDQVVDPRVNTRVPLSLSRSVRYIYSLAISTCLLAPLHAVDQQCHTRFFYSPAQGIARSLRYLYIYAHTTPGCCSSHRSKSRHTPASLIFRGQGVRYICAIYIQHISIYNGSAPLHVCDPVVVPRVEVERPNLRTQRRRTWLSVVTRSPSPSPSAPLASGEPES